MLHIYISHWYDKVVELNWIELYLYYLRSWRTCWSAAWGSPSCSRGSSPWPLCRRRWTRRTGWGPTASPPFMQRSSCPASFCPSRIHIGAGITEWLELLTGKPMSHVRTPLEKEILFPRSKHLFWLQYLSLSDWHIKPRTRAWTHAQRSCAHVKSRPIFQKRRPVRWT